MTWRSRSCAELAPERRQHGRKRHEYNASNYSPDEHPWNKSDPLQFLETLKRNPQKVIAVYDQAPPGWIINTTPRSSRIAGLQGARVARPRDQMSIDPSSSIDRWKAGGLSFARVCRGSIPLSGNSDLQYNSDDQIRHLTFERQRSQPMSPETMLFSVARQELRRGESLAGRESYKAAIDAYFRES